MREKAGTTDSMAILIRCAASLVLFKAKSISTLIERNSKRLEVYIRSYIFRKLTVRLSIIFITKVF